VDSFVLIMFSFVLFECYSASASWTQS